MYFAYSIMVAMVALELVSVARRRRVLSAGEKAGKLMTVLGWVLLAVGLLNKGRDCALLVWVSAALLVGLCGTLIGGKAEAARLIAMSRAQAQRGYPEADS
jgi:hypothetical protein